MTDIEDAFVKQLFSCSQDERKRPWLRSEDNEERNARAQKAYEALFTVTARVPQTDEYRQFSSSVKKIAKDNFGYDYGHEEVIRLIA